MTKKMRRFVFSIPKVYVIKVTRALLRFYLDVK